MERTSSPASFTHGGRGCDVLHCLCNAVGLTVIAAGAEWVVILPVACACCVWGLSSGWSGVCMHRVRSPSCIANSLIEPYCSGMHGIGLVYGDCVAEVYGEVLTGRSDEMNRQASGLSVTEQKFAEKLVILTERGNGILIRLYNIKKVGLRRRHEPLPAVHAGTCVPRRALGRPARIRRTGPVSSRRSHWKQPSNTSSGSSLRLRRK